MESVGRNVFSLVVSDLVGWFVYYFWWIMVFLWVDCVMYLLIVMWKIVVGLCRDDNVCVLFGDLLSILSRKV